MMARWVMRLSRLCVLFQPASIWQAGARIAVTTLALVVTVLLQDARGQTGMDGVCAQTQDPTACQQMLNNAMSQGLVPGQDQFSGKGQLNGIEQGPRPSVIISPTQPGPRRPTEHSKLEEIYSHRAGSELGQFGYDLVGNGGTVAALQIGAIQDDYILGQGDGIIVALRGQENATYTIFVDRDGNVTLPRLRPISAVGRRFGDFRQELEAAIKQGYIQTQAYITIGQIRQISVNVVGEVFNPGVYALTGLSSVLDALNVAGGIRKGGSLRNIAVVRNGETLRIDLYKFLTTDGSAQDITLRQGDRIVVAPLGATAAVAGDVRRPGIYELRPGEHATTAASLIALANGFSIRGTYRQTIIRTRPDGKIEYVDTTGHSGAAVRDGEIVTLSNAVNYTLGNVTLEGNVRVPGIFALNNVKTLHDLLPSAQAFLPMTYIPFGFIIRQDKATLASTVIPFSVQLVIAGKFDVPLESQDVVHILTANAMRELLALRFGSNAPQTQNPNSPPLQPGQSPNTQGQPNAPNGGGTTGAPNSSGTVGQTGQTPATGSAATTAGLLQALAAQLNAPQPNNGAGTAQASQSGNSQFGTATQSVNGQNGSASTTSSAGEGAQNGVDTSGAPSSVEGLTADEAASIGLAVTDYRVTIEGGVRQPGDYLAVPGVPLDEIISAANGLQPDADLNAVEVTSLAIDNVGGRSSTIRKSYSLTLDKIASISLQRLDVVQIPRVPTDQEEGNVVLAGEVLFPGNYHILKGERLSSVLERAGGLTKSAYAIGAVFRRPSIAAVQQQAHDREADDLQKQLLASVAAGGNALAQAAGGSQTGGLAPQAAIFVQDVIAQLRSKPADGRMSIVADPAALAANPQADIELQPGDSLFVPKHPSEVDVTGEVLNPGSFRYVPNLDVSDYVEMSGGYDRYADEDHIFIVNPDGSSRRVSDELFNFQPRKLAPGSVIVIPRDLAPLDLGVLAISVTKVLSDLAISAASLAVLSKEN